MALGISLKMGPRGRRLAKKTRPHQAEIVRKQAKKKFGAGQWSVEVTSRIPLVLDLDARAAVLHASNAAAKATYVAARDGRDLETGVPRPKTKTGRTRMVDTGRFIKSIRRRKISGKPTRATAVIDSQVAPSGANVADQIGKRKEARKAGKVGKQAYPVILAREAQRGYQYFGAKGKIAALISASLQESTEAAADGVPQIYTSGRGRLAKAKDL